MSSLSPSAPDRGPLMAKPQVKVSGPVSVPIRVNTGFRACDRCGFAHDGGPISRAKRKVGVPGGHLYFCEHHFRDNCFVFIARRYVVTDI